MKWAESKLREEEQRALKYLGTISNKMLKMTILGYNSFFKSTTKNRKREKITIVTA